MIAFQDVLPVVELDASNVALIAAAVARVANSDKQKFDARSDSGLLEIECALDTEISVYDRGDSRYIVFFFQYATLEVRVGERPAKPNQPEVPTDGPDGNTPGATTETKFAMAA